MKIEILHNKTELNSFLLVSDGGQFLQTWEWGEFQKECNRRIWRLGIYDKNDLISTALIVEHRLPFNQSYLYSPYGPVFRKNLSDKIKEQAVKLLLSRARDITIATKKNKEIFLRLEPRLTKAEIGNFFFNIGMKKTAAVQPQDTLVVNLISADEQIMKSMHSKTRYNIRLAERQGIEIREGTEIEDLSVFWTLMELTTKRNDFHSHSRSYYEKMWKMFAHSDVNDQARMTIKLFIAKKKNQPLAAGLFSFFGDRAVYLHGASNYKYRQLMAPYALHWEVMKLAKHYGYQLYDMHGILPEHRRVSSSAKEINWQGITRFKKGFGGNEVNYVGAWDWIYSSFMYRVYNIARKLI